MNKQTCDMIKRIIDQNGSPVPIEILSKVYSVSDRTIYNYWDLIVFFTKKNSLPQALQFDNGKFTFSGEKQLAERYCQSVSSQNFYAYHLSMQERQNIIILLLICSKTPLKIEKIEDILFISKATVSMDLKRIKEYLDSLDIALNENKHFGLMIKCNEFQKRDLLFDCLESLGLIKISSWNIFSCDPCANFIKHLLKIDKYYSISEEIVTRSEERFSIDIPDFEFYKLVLIVCVMFYRIETEANVSFRDAPILDLNDNAFLFAEDICHHMERYVPYNENEVQYLSICIQGMKFILEKPALGHEEINFHILVKSLLHKLSLHYEINFMEDPILHEYLTAHISDNFHRMKSGEEHSNPFKEDIKRKYQKDFSTLKENISFLENALGKKFSDDEIAYILMHILASIERISYGDYLPRIIIACNTGMSTGNLLAEYIKKYFKINIITVCSIHNLKRAIRNNDCDLIISTIPLEIDDITSIKVNAILSEDDLKHIRQALSKIKPKKIQNFANIYPEVSKIKNFPFQEDSDGLSFSALLDDDLISLDREVSDWKEAIISAGELLLLKKKITVNYLHQMVDLVVRLGPYIVFTPGIALAHASPSDGALETGVSFVRLKKPVDFGSECYDPVRVIAAFSLQDTPENTSMLLNFMNTACQNGFIEAIYAAPDPECLRNVIASYEQKLKTSVPYIHVTCNGE